MDTTHRRLLLDFTSKIPPRSLISGFSSLRFTVVNDNVVLIVVSGLCHGSRPSPTLYQTYLRKPLLQNPSCVTYPILTQDERKHLILHVLTVYRDIHHSVRLVVLKWSNISVKGFVVVTLN